MNSLAAHLCCRSCCCLLVAPQWKCGLAARKWLPPAPASPAPARSPRSPSSSRSGKWAGAETEASRAECPGRLRGVQGRRAARGGFHEEQGRSRLPATTFWFRPGVSEAELLECLYRVGDNKYQGKGCAWMAWRLVGQAQPPDVGHHVVLREGQTCGSSSTSPPSSYCPILRRPPTSTSLARGSFTMS